MRIGPWLVFLVCRPPLGAAACPGGTPDFVTGVGPFCAGRHASVSGDQLAGVPPKRVQAELVQVGD